MEKEFITPQYAFQYTFKNKTGKYGNKKKKQRKNKVGTFTTIFAAGHPSIPNPCGQGLTWVALGWNRVSRGLLRQTYF